jgi:hypothetical protein
MIRALDDRAAMVSNAARLRASIRSRFAVQTMAATVADAYRAVVTAR